MALKILRDAEGVVHKVCFLFSRVAGAILIFLVVILVSDTFGRYIGYPILGSFELVKYGFALLVCFSIAYTDVEGGHISIDLFFNRFPKAFRLIFTKINELLSILISILIIWRLIKDALESMSLHERSSTLQVPIFLFILAIAFGFIILALVLILKSLNSLGEKKCQ
jgi:TRAP-type C4-dicarboxylate transport system permease small subunit